MIMLGLIKDKIKQTEIERKSMSKNHRENFNKTKERIELHRNKTKKSDVQNHVKKELSRHF